MANNDSEVFLLNTKLYNKANDSSLLVPKKRNLEGKVDVHSKGMAINRQKNNKTKQLKPQKIHANDLYGKLGHTGEDIMSATANKLHCSVRGKIEVCKVCATSKINQ